MVTTTELSKILLLESDTAAAGQVRSALGGSGSFDVECISKLSDGLALLKSEPFAAVLLNLSLSDSNGLETFDRVFAAAPDIPILIVGGGPREDLSKQAVERGAHDYLLPDHLDSYSLPRALRNAIHRKAVEDDLYVEKERAVVTLNSIGDAVLSTDISGNITYLNLVAEAMTGWPRQEAIGKPLADVFRIIDGPTRKTARDPMEMAVEQNRTVGLTVNCVLIRRDGFESAIEDSAAPIHDRSGRVIGAVIVFHDVSAARAMSLQMTHSAQHDVVTNLPETLIKNADTAMYHAKENGRNNFQFFKAEMNVKAVERQSLEGSLRRALERKEFLLHYQPKVNLETGEITGVEALIRWKQPDRGLVPPSQFVPIAEDCGLIVQIGRWVLREACRQAREWQDEGLPFKRVSINVSAVEFREKGFVEGVRAVD